jgi:hypothetical protein
VHGVDSSGLGKGLFKHSNRHMWCIKGSEISLSGKRLSALFRTPLSPAAILLHSDYLL